MAKKKTNNKAKLPKSKTGKEADLKSLVQSGSGIAEVLDDPGNLAHWLSEYMKSEVDRDSNTWRAKLQDIERFLGFFFERHCCYDIDKWTPSITTAYVKWLPKQRARNPRGGLTDRNLAPATCARNLDTLKRAAKWIHRQREFQRGVPFTKRHVIEVEEPDWQGLTAIDLTRLTSAAEQLVAIQTRATQRPRRNLAYFILGIHTGLRVEELNALELSQYQGKHLKNVHRTKSGKWQSFFLEKDVREALDEYIEHERGDGPGILLQSHTGNKLAQSNIYAALKRIAAQANSTLPPDEQINIHPHLLRHTFLRAVTDHNQGDIRATRAVSGLKSDKYLFRYIKLSDDEVRKRTTGIYDKG